MKHIYKDAKHLYQFFAARFSLRQNKKPNARQTQSRLKRYCKKVLSQSPYYKLFLSRPFTEWPILDKSECTRTFNAMNTQRLKLEDLLPLALQAERDSDIKPWYNNYSLELSSGAPGLRGLFVMNQSERGHAILQLLANILPSALGKRRIAVLANNKPYYCHGSASSLHEFRYFNLNKEKSSSFQSLSHYNANVIIAPAQTLVLLAKLKYQKRMPATLMPDLFVSTAEILDSEDKNLIEHCFNVAVREIYECAEGIFAYSCAHGSMHFIEQDLHLEKDYINLGNTSHNNPMTGTADTGRPRYFSPVITDFRRHTQPLVRYRLEDIVLENPEPCACGSSATRIKRIVARRDNLIWIPDSNKKLVALFPSRLEKVIARVDDAIRDFQIIQTDPTTLTIKLDPLNNQLAHSVRVFLEQFFKELALPVPKLNFTSLIHYSWASSQRRVIGMGNSR